MSDMPGRIARLPENKVGKRGRAKHPLGLIWLGMMRRCYSPSAHGYENYGGRGIGVCAAWRESFEQFVADIRPRPSLRHTLDRIDNDGNYEPGNVRWATKAEQARNKRNNRILSAQGARLTLEDWAKVTGIPKSTLFNRIRRGWDDEAVVSTPSQPKTDDNTLFPPGGRERCADLGLNAFTVASRLRRGWSFDRAITEPIARKHASR